MPVIRGASGLVIRCFKRVEYCADVLTGAAGPVFIVLAWLLTGLIGFVFFDVVARDLSWPTTFLLLPFYILVPANLYIQYYLVTHIPGGYPGATDPRDLRWITPNPSGLLAPERWGFRRRGVAPLPPRPQHVRRCRKCDGPKPVRAHHCSVCNRCVLLMDHHCPWINACVGLHNQRHFVLFMMWLSLGALIVAVLGYPHFWPSIDFYSYESWKAVTPPVLFTLAWILSIACGGAVFVLGAWHLFMVARGETSIESHDNDYLDKKAKSEGLIYLNPFDLGKRRNLENFFNIGPGGYSKWTLLFPLVVPPYTDGWSYPRRAMPKHADAPLLQHAEDRQAEAERRQHEERLVGDGPGGMYVMGGGDELTDDESGGGGWWVEDGDGNAAGNGAVQHRH